VTERLLGGEARASNARVGLTEQPSGLRPELVARLGAPFLKREGGNRRRRQNGQRGGLYKVLGGRKKKEHRTGVNKKRARTANKEDYDGGEAAPAETTLHLWETKSSREATGKREKTIERKHLARWQQKMRADQVLHRNKLQYCSVILCDEGLAVRGDKAKKKQVTRNQLESVHHTNGKKTRRTAIKGIFILKGKKKSQTTQGAPQPLHKHPAVPVARNKKSKKANGGKLWRRGIRPVDSSAAHARSRGEKRSIKIRRIEQLIKKKGEPKPRKLSLS